MASRSVELELLLAGIGLRANESVVLCFDGTNVWLAFRAA